jgi:hypothetical protein
MVREGPYKQNLSQSKGEGTSMGILHNKNTGVKIGSNQDLFLYTNGVWFLLVR